MQRHSKLLPETFTKAMSFSPLSVSDDSIFIQRFDILFHKNLLIMNGIAAK